MRFSLARSAALAGKTAIVTASTDGIGLAIARRLGQDGAKVWISSRKESNVDSALTSLKDEGLDVDGLGKVHLRFMKIFISSEPCENPSYSL